MQDTKHNVWADPLKQ